MHNLLTLLMKNFSTKHYSNKLTLIISGSVYAKAYIETTCMEASCSDYLYFTNYL